MNNLYQSIITAGTHLAPNIKVAEASKAIEMRKEMSIFIYNELALMFERMDIDTSDGIEAAATKWNFYPLNQAWLEGIVLADLYYLTYKANSRLPSCSVSSGRNVNDQMGVFVASKLIKLMIQRYSNQSSNILFLASHLKKIVLM